MKLKYNQNGVTETIPLSTRKKQGKRLAIHHNDQNYYAPVVETDDPKASNLPIGLNGEIFAVQAQEPPEITAVNVAPSSVAVMQGQSATATVSAIGNDAVTGLSYGLSGAPTWITISDDLILIRPSDNDLGVAQVQVYAQDTGSDAMSAAIFAAEAKLRPIIESLSVIPPAVTVMQGQSATASVSAVANEAVGSVQYSLGDAPNWLTLNNDVIVMEPTDNDLGTATVDVFARDINSSASAATQFVASAEARPKITDIILPTNSSTAYLLAGYSVTATVKTEGAVTGVALSTTSSSPDWVTVTNRRINISPPAGTSLGTYNYTLQATASNAETFSKVFSVTVTKARSYLFYRGGNEYAVVEKGSGGATVPASLEISGHTNVSISVSGYAPGYEPTIKDITPNGHGDMTTFTLNFVYNKDSITTTAGAECYSYITVLENETLKSYNTLDFRWDNLAQANATAISRVYRIRGNT